MDEAPAQNRVFVCYARRDKKYLDELQTHLTPEVRAGVVDLWDDTRIKAGETWHEEIKHALAVAKVAICLVSKHFRASKYIAEHELPPLLEAAKSRGLVILPVVVSPCNFEESQLAGVQAVNDPSKALTGLTPHQRDQIWVKVVRRTKEAISEVTGPIESPAAPPPAPQAATQRPEKRLGGELGIEELVAQGSSLNKEGRYFEATHPLEKALRQDGSHFRAWFEFAFALANSDPSGLAEARAAFMRAYDLAGRPPSDRLHQPTRVRQPNAERVTLCTGTGSGIFYHTLGTQPDKALLVGTDGTRDQLVPDAIAATTLRVTHMANERWVAMVYTEPPTNRPTATQIAKKLVQDPDSIDFIDHLLRRMSQSELERLLLHELPQTYLQNLNFVQVFRSNPAGVNALKRCFRPTFERANNETRRKVAARFMSILTEESQATVVAYEEAFFKATDMRYLDLDDAELVKSHLLSRLSSLTVPASAAMEMVEGIGTHLNTDDEARQFLIALLRTFHARYAEVAPGDVHAIIVSEYHNMQPGIRSAAEHHVGAWLEAQLQSATKPDEAEWLEQVKFWLTDRSGDTDQEQVLKAIQQFVADHDGKNEQKS